MAKKSNVSSEEFSPWQVWKHRHFVTVYIFASILVFSLLALILRNAPPFIWDISITKFVQSINLPGFSTLMNFYASFGATPKSNYLTTAIIILLVLLKQKWASVVFFLGTLGAVQFFYLFTDLVNRPRPTRELVSVTQVINLPGFPSGHVLIFTTIFGFLLYLCFIKIKNRLIRRLFCGFLIVSIVLMGMSRFYRGEHWPSDVLGSYLLASVWVVVLIQIYEFGSNWNERSGHNLLAKLRTRFFPN